MILEGELLFFVVEAFCRSSNNTKTTNADVNNAAAYEDERERKRERERERKRKRERKRNLNVRTLFF